MQVLNLTTLWKRSIGCVCRNRKTNAPMSCLFLPSKSGFCLGYVWEITNEHVDAVMYPKKRLDSFKYNDRKKVYCRVFSSPSQPSSKSVFHSGSSFHLLGAKWELPSSEKQKTGNWNMFSSVGLAGIVIPFLGSKVKLLGGWWFQAREKYALSWGRSSS
jgi:hypothetical protein